MKNIVIAGLLSSVSLLGCAQDDMVNELPPGDDIDQQLLAEYRSALPTMGDLEATTPESSASALRSLNPEVGQPAELPSGSYDIAIGINTAVSGIVEVMRNVVELPPTIYNSNTKEFVWGPFENDEGIGYVAAYIRDAGESEDFRYHYALLRGIDNDVANMVPVIWGGATPDANNQDHGVGITLWDFEANRAFEEANNPDYANLALDQGRFVALYAKGIDENDAAAEVAMVLAVFRNFVPKDKPGDAPANLDYFYGRYSKDGTTMDFLDWEAGIDVSDPVDGLAENLGVRMAFLNEGTGRAEADATGGSLADNEEMRLVECWDAGLDQTHLSIERLVDGNTAETVALGEAADCGLFQSSLTELEIPSLDDVDPAMRSALEQVAETGVPAE